MPIPVVPTAPPPPPPLPVTGRPRLTGFGIEFQRAGHPTITFSTKSDASTSGWRALTGALGTDLPPTEVYRKPIPDQAGSVYLGSRHGEREMFFRLGVDDVTYKANRDRVRALWAMVGDLQPFDVVLAQPEGDRVRARCRYVTGLEGSYTDSDWWVNRRHLGVTVLALDPLFYFDPVTEEWPLDVSTARPFLSLTSGFFPVSLGNSLIAGERVLVNKGNVDARLVVTVVGPGSGDAVVANVSTGRQVTVQGALGVGESVTIDGRRGMVDVFDQDGVDAWDRVPLGEQPFPLVPGPNRVRVSMPGATTGSLVVASWESARRTGH